MEFGLPPSVKMSLLQEVEEIVKQSGEIGVTLIQIHLRLQKKGISEDAHHILAALDQLKKEKKIKIKTEDFGFFYLPI